MEEIYYSQSLAFLNHRVDEMLNYLAIITEVDTYYRTDVGRLGDASRVELDV